MNRLMQWLHTGNAKRFPPWNTTGAAKMPAWIYTDVIKKHKAIISIASNTVKIRANVAKKSAAGPIVIRTDVIEQPITACAKAIFGNVISNAAAVLKSLKQNSFRFSIPILTFHCDPGRISSLCPLGRDVNRNKVWFRLFPKCLKSMLPEYLRFHHCSIFYNRVQL